MITNVMINSILNTNIDQLLQIQSTYTHIQLIHIKIC